MNRPTTTKKTGEKKTAGKSEITRVCSGATVGLIDPSLEQGGQWDVNLGDNIIVESVCSVLKDLCGLRVLTKIPSLRKLTGRHYHQLKNCSYIIVGGSNLLSSNMNKYRQWMITLLDLFRLKNVILLGVGWWQYQQNPNLYTKLLLRRVLHRTR
ncbi:MAG: polysaccharide pyruvyl transferase family protein, partial [Anaerolineales bacterium]